MMWKIGHRGASGHYPENTMLAFRKAIEMGANALELDVFACKSGEAVVIHDDTLERTTSGHGRVEAYTFLEIRQFDAGSGEKIPLLEDVLAAFANKYVIFIEIKSAAASAPAAKLVMQFAQRGVPYDNMPLIGFHEEWLLAAHRTDQNIRIGITPDESKPIPADYCAHAKKIGAWSVNPCIDQLDEAFMENAHRHSLKVITWTVNTPAAIQKAKALGAHGIISDYPDRL